MYLKSKLDRRSTPIRITNIKHGTRLKDLVVVTCISKFVRPSPPPPPLKSASEKLVSSATSTLNTGQSATPIPQRSWEVAVDGGGGCGDKYEGPGMGANLGVFKLRVKIERNWVKSGRVMILQKLGKFE